MSCATPSMLSAKVLELVSLSTVSHDRAQIATDYIFLYTRPMKSMFEGDYEYIYKP
jgi:hypothetical protein